MVGRDDVDAIADARPRAMQLGRRGLDGGIALDLRAEHGIARLVEPQVVRANLRGDSLGRDRSGLEQLELTRRRQVQHVQPRAMALGEIDRHRRRAVARLGGTDQRVRFDRDSVAVALAVALLVLPDQRRVLAVRRNRHARLGENSFERLRVVDEHVARRRAHEHLDAAGVCGRDALDLLEIRVGRAEVEPVVDVAAGGRDPPLLGQRRAIRRRRLRVRHVEKARDAAAKRRQRLRGQRRLVREAGLAAVHLVVDETRQEVLAAQIDRRRAGGHRARTDTLDAIVADQHVGRDDAPFVDELRIGQQ